MHVPLFVKPAGGRTRAVTDEPITGAGVHDLIAREVGLALDLPTSPSPVTMEWFWGNGLRLDDVEDLSEKYGVDLKRDLGGWVENGRKFILTSTGEVRAFDLAVDPMELSPLVLTQAEEEAALERVRAWWRDNPAPAPVEVGLDEAAMRAMAGVGYAGE